MREGFIHPRRLNLPSVETYLRNLTKHMSQVDSICDKDFEPRGLMLRPLSAKDVLGFSANREVPAEAAMIHFRQFTAADRLSGQNSWQQKIKAGGFTVKPAGWHADDGYFPDPGRQGHGTRQDRGAIDQIRAARIHQSLALHVIRIHRQSGGGNDQPHASRNHLCNATPDDRAVVWQIRIAMKRIRSLRFPVSAFHAQLFS